MPIADRTRLRARTLVTPHPWPASISNGHTTLWLTDVFLAQAQFPPDSGGLSRAQMLKMLERIRAVMHHFQGEQGQRRSVAPSRKLWSALHALNGYLTRSITLSGTGLDRGLGRQSPKEQPTSW
jgi:hypothetical protein